MQPFLALITPVGGSTGPVDPGYSPPWARPPVDPGWSGGVAPPYPSQGPGFPTHPIVLPPPPGSGKPPIAAQLPVFPPEATHPIVLPPDVAPPTTPDGRPIDWKVAWSPVTGWVVVGIPSEAHPAPSA